MKKIIFASTLTIISAVTFAQGMYEPTVDHFSGVYLGGGLGYSQNTVDSFSRNSVSAAGSDLTASLSSMSDAGFAGQVFGGYGHVFSNKFYLGGDIFYQYTNPKVTNTRDYTSSNGTLNDVLSISVKQQNSLGLATHLGYVMPDGWMPYFLIGSQYTSVKSSVSSGTSSTSYDVNDSSSYNKWGLLAGAGVQMHIKNNWLAGLEYEYVYRGKVKNSITPGTTGRFSGSTFALNYRPNLSTIIARIAYRLDV